MLSSRCVALMQGTFDKIVLDVAEKGWRGTHIWWK
jgi:hypothetical protein